MENKNVKTIEKSNVDAANAGNIKKKISLKKSSLELIQKEGKEQQSGTSSKKIYKGLEGKTTEEQKQFRGKIRRDLNRFVSIILGKDRSEQERIEGIEDFLEFYKTHWIITDFKIENFSSKKNDADLKDYRMLLQVVKDSME